MAPLGPENRERARSPGINPLQDGFLTTASARVRIVIEVDGKAHYANDAGRADATRYSAMVRADRGLKLAGYEVFHFGAEELQNGDSGEIVRSFFELLFKEYRVTVSTNSN